MDRNSVTRVFPSEQNNITGLNGGNLKWTTLEILAWGFGHRKVKIETTGRSKVVEDWKKSWISAQRDSRLLNLDKVILLSLETTGPSFISLHFWQLTEMISNVLVVHNYQNNKASHSAYCLRALNGQCLISDLWNTVHVEEPQIHSNPEALSPPGGGPVQCDPQRPGANIGPAGPTA